jgi:hypothetical protein
MRVLLAALLLLLAAAPARARPVVVELFTSEACSSCPPAEALLATLARDPGVLALAFHVTYWNGPAWTDKYSLTAATDRQSYYAGIEHSDNVFTPQAVVDGTASMVGSNRGQVTAAIAAARAAAAPAATVKIAAKGSMLTIDLGDGFGNGTIWLFGFDPAHTTQIGGGENGGATVAEANVVRSISSLGQWAGAAMRYTMPRPAGERVAVIVQEADGTILGAGAE